MKHRTKFLSTALAVACILLAATAQAAIGERMPGAVPYSNDLIQFADNYASGIGRLAATGTTDRLAGASNGPLVASTEPDNPKVWLGPLTTSASSPLEVGGDFKQVGRPRIRSGGGSPPLIAADDYYGRMPGGDRAGIDQDWTVLGQIAADILRADVLRL